MLFGTSIAFEHLIFQIHFFQNVLDYDVDRLTANRVINDFSLATIFMALFVSAMFSFMLTRYGVYGCWCLDAIFLATYLILTTSVGFLLLGFNSISAWANNIGIDKAVDSDICKVSQTSEWEFYCLQVRRWLIPGLLGCFFLCSLLYMGLWTKQIINQRPQKNYVTLKTKRGQSPPLNLTTQEQPLTSPP